MPLQPNSHIQGLSVRIASHCGQPNQAQNGDCIVCGRSNEQIKETAVLGYLESTTYRGESYNDQQRRRNAYLVGMDQGTVIFIPRGVSQAAAVTAIFTKSHWMETTLILPQEYSPFKDCQGPKSNTNCMYFVIMLITFNFTVKDSRSIRPQCN